MAGTPLYPDDWATKFAALEQRVKDAFTAAQTRVKFARIVAQLLTVGEGDGRIELAPGVPPTIRFVTAGGTSTIAGHSGAASSGMRMESASQDLSFPAEALVEILGLYSKLYAADTGFDAQAEVRAEVQDSPKRAGVTIAATSTVNQASSRIDLIASGGVALPDLAANPATTGIAVLYTVGNSLRWKDSAGVVHVIV